MTEAESLQYQMDEWVAGRPWHNTVRDECCPDFSCCGGDLAPADVRQAFARADDDTQFQMLAMFLGKMIDKHHGDGKVYVAGVDDPNAETH